MKNDAVKLPLTKTETLLTEALEAIDKSLEGIETQEALASKAVEIRKFLRSFIDDWEPAVRELPN
ncbi:hypothetical protein LCGC14_0671040 [marine sediment metagenome]|uniref:Uncharacterized protein n=1 Tax=marine sediment metagenome TaxID=412755 RepID=A0A0F9QVW9_9ZZZZ